MKLKSKRLFLFGGALVFLLICASCASNPPDEQAPEDELGDGIDGDSNDEDSAGNVPDDIADTAAEADDAAIGLDDDLIAVPADVPPELAEPELANGTPQVVYINFGGPIVRTCSSFCNDAVTNHSTLIRQTFFSPVVDFLPYTSVTGRRLIVSRLRTYYAPYNVNVTTRRPTSGSYTMVVVSPSAVGSSAKRGVAYLDCGNSSTRRDLAFIFRIRGVSAATIARYAAHELGHTLGLMHVRSSSDLMQYASSGTRFTSSSLDVARNPPGYTCFPGSSVQNAPATLKRNVGLRP